MQVVLVWLKKALDCFRKLKFLFIVSLICVFTLPGGDREIDFLGIPVAAGGEFFPLSSFPMYSRNKHKSYVVYLTDADGNPIATEKQLGVRSSILKKDYNAELMKIKSKIGVSDYDMTIEQKEPAALSMRNYLITERAASRLEALNTEALQLVDVRIEMDRKTYELSERTEVVARLDLP